MVDHGRVIRRHELSDVEWEFLGPLLPVSLRGRKRLDDRKVLNGIVWKFRTGTAGGTFRSGTARGPRCIPAYDGGH
ncbi:transposase [Streptomyces sp. NPDC052301]|uniref:transposase n=1 Tax=Streptomyces sp. NPDC052301 TaxID=3365687 RepID=UPI0037D2C299